MFNNLFIHSQDPEIIKQIEELDVLKNLSELVGRGAFDIRKGVSCFFFHKDKSCLT